MAKKRKLIRQDHDGAQYFTSLCDTYKSNQNIIFIFQLTNRRTKNKQTKNDIHLETTQSFSEKTNTLMQVM